MDSFHLLGISFYAFFGYNMAKIGQFLPENLHFEGLSFNPTYLSFSKTVLNLMICSSGVLEKTITSSR